MTAWQKQWDERISQYKVKPKVGRIVLNFKNVFSIEGLKYNALFEFLKETRTTKRI